MSEVRKKRRIPRRPLLNVETSRPHIPKSKIRPDAVWDGDVTPPDLSSPKSNPASKSGTNADEGGPQHPRSPGSLIDLHPALSIADQRRASFRGSNSSSPTIVRHISIPKLVPRTYAQDGWFPSGYH